jgi:hypothetical protein
MAIVLAYFFCCSLVVIALFGIALYVTAADNRRLRAALAKAKVTEMPVAPVAVVAPRLVDLFHADATNYGTN